MSKGTFSKEMSEFRFFMMEGEQKNLLKEILKDKTMECMMQPSTNPFSYQIVNAKQVDSIAFRKPIGKNDNSDGWLRLYLRNRSISPSPVYHEPLNEKIKTKSFIGKINPKTGKLELEEFSQPTETRYMAKATPDFTESGFMEFIPSMLVGNKILLQGRIAIMNKNRYKGTDIDGDAMKEWFQKIKRLIIKKCGPYKKLRVISETEGDITHLYRIPSKACVSPAVLEWQKSGKKLKEFTVKDLIYLGVEENS